MIQLPAYLQNNPSGRKLSTDVVANIGAGTPPYLSIKGNRFTLFDSIGDSEPVTTMDPKTGMPYLDCVIVDVLERVSRIYYEKPYDPSAQNYAPPECFSDNGVAPSRACSSPQHVTCAGCPKVVWGSATSRVSGKGVPACSMNQKLALMIPGDDVTFLLRVPPNSLNPLRNYMRKFEAQDFDVLDVMTRISFEPDVLGTLTFTAFRATADGYLTEQVAAQRNKVIASKVTDGLIGRLDLPREGAALAPPANGGQAPALASPVAPPANGGQGPAPAAAQPTEPAPAAGRRGRRKVAEAPAAGGQATNSMAPFRPAESPVAPPPQAGTGGFGVSPGIAPNADLAKALDDVFGPQT